MFVFLIFSLHDFSYVINLWTWKKKLICYTKMAYYILYKNTMWQSLHEWRLSGTIDRHPSRLTERRRIQRLQTYVHNFVVDRLPQALTPSPPHPLPWVLLLDIYLYKKVHHTFLQLDLDEDDDVIFWYNLIHSIYDVIRYCVRSCRSVSQRMTMVWIMNGFPCENDCVHCAKLNCFPFP